MGIRNIHELRSFVAEQLERLCDGKIDPEKANAAAMLSANMLLACKLEMEYSKLKQQSPHINFMENKESNLIEGKPIKTIGHTKKWLK